MGAAADKFTKATAADVSDPEILDGSTQGGDTRWMTLHVEHLLAFVDCVCKAFEATPPPTEVPLQLWASRAETAWREAVALADAATQLELGSGRSGWEASALRGDTFAAGATLLGSLSCRIPAPRLNLPDSLALSNSGLDGPWESVEAPSYAGGHSLDESQAVVRAEAAYSEALTTADSAGKMTVGIAMGELWLNRARRVSGEESAAYLKRAGETFQSIATSTDGSVEQDLRASAWYNLACVASLLGKVDHAVEALQRCFRHVPPVQRRRWATEVTEDQDLSSLRGHAAIQSLLSGG